MAKQEFTAVVFLDIQGAYDNVIPQILVDQLQKLRIPSPIISVIAKILEKRDLNFYHNGKFLGNRMVHKGLGQGLVTSPLLYNIYTKDINHHLSESCSSVQYADHVSLWVSDPNYDKCLEKITKELTNIIKYFNSIGLTLSMEKTQFMLFHRKKKTPKNHSIEILGTTINSTKEAKFLEVIFDERMTWNPFIRDIKQKSTAATNLLKMLTKHSWGMHPSTALNVYKSIVRPRIEWAIHSSLSASKSKHLILEREQYKALRVVLGVLRSTPTNIILDLVKEPSIRNRADHLTQRYLARCRLSRRNPVTGKLEPFHNHVRTGTPQYSKSFLYQTWVEEKSALNNLDRHESIPCYLYPLPCQLFPVSIDLVNGRGVVGDRHRAIPKFTQKIRRKWPDWTHIFTDGSKMKGKQFAGFSFVIPSLKKGFGFQINNLYNIFEAESLALLQALRYAKDNIKNNILICSDSQSALQALNHSEVSTRTHPFTLEIKSMIQRIRKSGFQVEFVWTPAHIGIKGNEEADKLAKLACDKGKKLNLKNYVHKVFIKPGEASTERENNRIREKFKSKGKEYAKWRNIKEKRPWFTQIQLPRSGTGIINRIRSGHCTTNVYLHMIGKLPDPSCQCGHLQQDLEHLLWHCPLNLPHTEKLIRLLQIKKIPMPYDIRKLAFSLSIKEVCQI
ncbi:uncharacterized protein LOC107042388 [Diachasma alloeum]|uniref:uncharacterized protein LOC107042388 n=1 Tax=Diachasma alloeum TaxID=454923 RepID=UPI00073839F1|nr:uncharacterized protein LOC107042388 [Diachasma alloeum]